MKTRLFPFVIAASLFASCKKDGKTEPAMQDIVQIQKIELGTSAVLMEYNDKNQVTRMDLKEGASGNLRLYFTFNYETPGLIKAAQFYNTGSAFVKTAEFHYGLDAQKRLKYLTVGATPEGGANDWKDTVDFTFNTDNKLTRFKRRSGDIDAAFAYDNNGNYKPADRQQRDADFIFDYKYDYRYDNNPNPFNKSGLGLLLYTLYGESAFGAHKLLSTNNPVSTKYTFLKTNLDGNGQPTDQTYQITETTSFSNTLDENGFLKQQTELKNTEKKENGTVTDNSNSEGQLLKLTVVKKQVQL